MTPTLTWSNPQNRKSQVQTTEEKDVLLRSSAVSSSSPLCSAVHFEALLPWILLCTRALCALLFTPAPCSPAPVSTPSVCLCTTPPPLHPALHPNCTAAHPYTLPSTQTALLPTPAPCPPPCTAAHPCTLPSTPAPGHTHGGGRGVAVPRNERAQRPLVQPATHGKHDASHQARHLPRRDQKKIQSSFNQRLMIQGRLIPKSLFILSIIRNSIVTPAPWRFRGPQAGIPVHADTLWGTNKIPNCSLGVLAKSDAT